MKAVFRVLALCASLAVCFNIKTLESPAFKVDLDLETGALHSIVHPNDSAQMSWISSPENAPWQPITSRWGLGYSDMGGSYLHRYYWREPQITEKDGASIATYKTGDLQIEVTRRFDDEETFSEQYAFTNLGNGSLYINKYDTIALTIFTPFNDHYTNTSDVLEHRCHAHLWTFGGASSWVKMIRMGGRGPHLGLVLTEGSLSGYSINNRDHITQSNTRGVILTHPGMPILDPGQTSVIAWKMFWHDDWEDFFAKSSRYSNQFVRFNASAHTAFPGEDINITLSGAVGENSTLKDGNNTLALQEQGSTYTASFKPDKLGEHTLLLSTGSGLSQRNTSIIINATPRFEDIIANRTRFIAKHQQIDPAANATIGGAYVVYDNQINSVVTFDTYADRNAARERVGMGVLIARWLKDHPDDILQESLKNYYEFVNTKLQDETGYVRDGPLGSGDTFFRLYNWPWVMQLHLYIHALNWTMNDTPVITSNSTKTPLQRFVQTVESFYANNGTYFYPIGIPMLKGLRALNTPSTQTEYNRVFELFTAHATQLAKQGTNYPPSEVNFEQSIVAPASIMLLELYRATGNTTWLSAAKPHFTLLQHFGGLQPDYRLHEIAIRHWDGYWFGKDRIWGDTQPHYWSSLTAVAMHHYAMATGDMTFEERAMGILRSNLANFDPDGRAYCAWNYPLSVDGREAHRRDPYANDQDWALVHVLQVLED